jgi:hypothetical protein
MVPLPRQEVYLPPFNLTRFPQHQRLGLICECLVAMIYSEGEFTDISLSKGPRSALFPDISTPSELIEVKAANVRHEVTLTERQVARNRQLVDMHPDHEFRYVFVIHQFSGVKSYSGSFSTLIRNFDETVNFVLDVPMQTIEQILDDPSVTRNAKSSIFPCSYNIRRGVLEDLSADATAEVTFGGNGAIFHRNVCKGFISGPRYLRID